MADVTTVQDGSGRSRFTIRESGPDIFVSSIQSVNGQAGFAQVIDVDVSRAHDGEILLTSQIVGAGSEDYVGIEVAVVGYIGSTQLVLTRAMLGGDAPEHTFEWCDGRSYDRIAVQARQIVNGLASSATLPTNNLQAVGRFWR